MPEEKTLNIVTWCNENQGFLSAILAVTSIFISIVALYLSSKTDKKQRANALYEKRLTALSLIGELMEYITCLESYKTRLYNLNAQSIKNAVYIIADAEINMQWVYEFKKTRFVVEKKERSSVDDISDEVSELLRNYRIFKECVNKELCENEDIERVFANIDSIKDKAQHLRVKLEEKLYL